MKSSQQMCSHTKWIRLWKFKVVAKKWLWLYRSMVNNNSGESVLLPVSFTIQISTKFIFDPWLLWISQLSLPYLFCMGHTILKAWPLITTLQTRGATSLEMQLRCFWDVIKNTIITAISWLPPWISQLFSHGTFCMGPYLYLQLGCFWGFGFSYSTCAF